MDQKLKDYRTKEGITVINHLSLNGHSQLLLWMDLIGFRNPKNLAKFELWKERNKENPRVIRLINHSSVSQQPLNTI